MRVPGTAVFMTARPEGAPPILVHHLKHNKVLHEQIVLLTVSMLNTPTISEGEPIEVQHDRQRVLPRDRALRVHGVAGCAGRARAARARRGCGWHDEDTTFYLARSDAAGAATSIGMSVWRDKLFIFLSRNARRATNFFNIPVDRVVEIGIQLEI